MHGTPTAEQHHLVMQSVGSQNQLGLRDRLQHDHLQGLEVRQNQRDGQEHDRLQGLEVRQDQRDEQEVRQNQLKVGKS